jgi:hypothetical protein
MQCSMRAPSIRRSLGENPRKVTGALEPQINNLPHNQTAELLVGLLLGQANLND